MLVLVIRSVEKIYEQVVRQEHECIGNNDGGGTTNRPTNQRAFQQTDMRVNMEFTHNFAFTLVYALYVQNVVKPRVKQII